MSKLLRPQARSLLWVLWVAAPGVGCGGEITWSGPDGAEGEFAPGASLGNGDGAGPGQNGAAGPGGGDGVNGPGGPGDPLAGGDGSGVQDNTPVEVEVDTCQELPIAQPMRRIDVAQYTNIIAQLLGPEIDPGMFPIPAQGAEYASDVEANPMSLASLKTIRDASEHVALQAVEDVQSLAPCARNQARDACLRSFVESFGPRAYRRPLQPGEVTRLLDLVPPSDPADYQEAVAVVLSAMLQSPSFLYRVEAGDGSGGDSFRLTGHEVASRLSFLLWNSMPDQPLLDAAATGELDNPQGIETQVARMLSDAAGKDRFLSEWMHLARLDAAAADPMRFPDPSLATAMAEEAMRFLSEVDTLQELMTSRRAVVDPMMAEFYGVDAGAGLSEVELPQERGAGILTRAATLAAISNTSVASPTVRGLFIRERLLCQTMPAPPQGASEVPIPGDSARERIENRMAHDTCGTCHQLMDGAGVGLWRFDVNGRSQGNDPLDTAGEIISGGDASGSFSTTAELGALLSSSETVGHCTVSNLMHHAFGYAFARDDNPCSRARLASSLMEPGGTFTELLTRLTALRGFTERDATGGN